MPETLSSNIIDISKLENVRELSDRWVARCPMCALEGHDETGNHLSVWKGSMKFNCIVATKNKIHNRGILQLVGTQGDGNVDMVDTSIYIHRASNEITYYDDSHLSRLVRDFSYWINRGIRREVVESYEGGLAIQGKLANRYVFVLRDTHNRIVGFSGRYVKEMAKGSKIVKYKIIGRKGLCIFDSARVSEEVAKTGVVGLTEGVPDVLALRQAGLGGFYPAFGVVPSSAVIGHLIKLRPGKIVLSFNNESSGIGNEAAEECKVTLSNYFNPDSIIIRLPQTGKDWLDATEEEREAFRKEILG